MRSTWMCVALSLLAGIARAQDPSAELLSATLWIQTSPEYRAATQQAYRLATERIANPSPGSAALEQAAVSAEQLARLPTAVVLDVDETVLDNTVYQARLLREHRGFDDASWGQWVAEAKAEAVPGAREFIAAARQLGHAVFYVSNRDCSWPPPTPADPCPAKAATLRNLALLGIEPSADPARLLLRGERPDWHSKSQRRASIAANYRIIAMVGDDLGDFTDVRGFAGDRARQEWRFGVNWFVLPNPIYGSWLNGMPTTPQRYAALRTEPPVLELPGVGPWRGDAPKVRIATWNVEYLMTPQTHLALRADCAENGGMVGGDARTLPCAITRREPRSAADYESLRSYAAQLRADIVALQEVDGPEAAEQVFPGYEFCFSARAHPQKNGFAIRRGLPFRCEPEYEALSLDNAVRRGVVATFFPGSANEFRLMSVHLKSGCAAGPLTAPGRNCELLSRQVEPLEQWIDDQARAGHRFGVLGDFNRRFSVEKGGARADDRPLNVYAEIDDGDPEAAKLTDITARNRFTPCTKGSPYREFIDTVLLGRDLAGSVLKNSFVRVVFNDQDAAAHWLSDHCPVGIELGLK